MQQRGVWHRIGWAAMVSLAPAAWGDNPETTVARAETFTGTVVAVLDGDTLRVTRGGSTEVIGLCGIDCPELGQPYGTHARRFTSDLTLWREVTVSFVDDKTTGARPVDRPRFQPVIPSALERLQEPADEDTIVADVILEDGTVLNLALVEAGLAWCIPGNSDEQRWRLKKAHAEALAAKRGLWADVAPVAPWDLCGRNAAEAAVRVNKWEGEALPDPGTTSQEGVFVTREGKQYHKYGCRHLDQSRKLLARAEAEKRGYDPCLLCFPETLNRNGRRLAAICAGSGTVVAQGASKYG